MQESLIDKVLDATNRGLEIIFYYYPQAQGCENSNKLFKVRGNEKTASASLKLIKNVWRVTDFGDEGYAIGPFDICMKEESLDFREALYRLADRYNVATLYIAEKNEAEITKRPATEAEKEGDFTFELNENFSEYELSVLGPMVTEEICARYKYYSVKSYSKIKNRQAIIISSTPNYPIFMRDCGTFKKVYQPLNYNKGFRFFYVGEKPKDYVNGLEELKKAYEKFLSQQDDDEDFENEKKQKKPTKLPEAVFCSGERDALNCAGAGCLPLWMNSETAILPKHTYDEIARCVEKIYNIPDIDDTGIKKGCEFAMQYIDVYTVELPEKLSSFRDHRGRPRKDLRDFFEIYNKVYYFNELLRMAKPCKFWEKVFSNKSWQWEINTVFLLHFLKYNGFGKISDVASGKITFVQIQGYEVKEITGKQIRNFILSFMEERKVDHDIKNLMLNSKRTGVSVMDDLSEVVPDFTDFGSDYQLFFFKNKAVKVTEKTIEESRGIEAGNHVWEKDIIPHSFKRIEPAFTFSYNKEDENIEFKINNTKSHYFRFLINGSRIYWREEFENRTVNSIEKNEQYIKDHKFDISGPRLEENEQQEQFEHLLNKIFIIGYLLHRYKAYSKAWGVWVMENKITEEDESSGGSGKSFMINFLKNMCRTITLDGRNKRLTENQHLLDRVDLYTDVLLIDDAYKYFDFNYFYSMITGNMIVNEKNIRSKEIDFKDAPKITITSNFPPPESDSSTMRRILLCVFSDYYHKATDQNGYFKDMRISDDFGYDLHDEKYTENHWNEDFNFCIDCLQFYLFVSKYNIVYQPPMQNVIRRMNIQQMGEQFREWAEVFFSPDGGNLNRSIEKSLLMELFSRATNVKGWSSRKFSKAIKSFVNNTSYIECLNPKELCNSDGRRIAKKINGQTVEMYYLKTYDTPVINEIF